jgi:hypothetical protein
MSVFIWILIWNGVVVRVVVGVGEHCVILIERTSMLVLVNTALSSLKEHQYVCW